MNQRGYVPDRPKQIILASRTEQENAILRKKLNSLIETVPGGARITTTRPQATKLELAGNPDLVIFNFNDWNQNELQFVEGLRQEGYERMIMILAKADAPTAVQNLALLERVVYLEKPFEIRDLVGIAEKAISQGAVAQRIYRRFNTEQQATVEFSGGANGSGAGGNRAIGSRIFNMSKTGAYLELNSLQDVNVGEMVKLRMELEDVSRTYVMPAKIVWTQNMGRTGGTGVGVHFTGRGAVRRHIFQV
jgi:response regulator RpfG family c-di-GMP phosphodiesterase